MVIWAYQFNFFKKNKVFRRMASIIVLQRNVLSMVIYSYVISSTIQTSATIQRSAFGFRCLYKMNQWLLIFSIANNKDTYLSLEQDYRGNPSYIEGTVPIPASRDRRSFLHISHSQTWLCSFVPLYTFTKFPSTPHSLFCILNEK